MSESLASITACQQEAILQSISQRNAAFFESEANKLDAWAEDLKIGLEREIRELDRQIREAGRAATAAPTLQKNLRPRNTSNLLRRTVTPDGGRCLTPKTTSIAIASSLSLRWKASSDKRRFSRSCSQSGGRSSERQNLGKYLLTGASSVK
jgi:hypothetical protein